MGVLDRAKGWAERLKRDVLALWLAARDPEVPPLAKLAAGVTAAYALSPIDLIPDVIPVLGLLDDLILVPLGIALAVRLIPAAVLARLRVEAAAVAERPTGRRAAAAILLLWTLAAGFVGYRLTGPA